MEISFRLKASELSADFVKTIRRLYKKHNLFITVKNADEMDETEYLLASETNRKILEQSVKEAESGNLVKVNIGKR